MAAAFILSAPVTGRLSWMLLCSAVGPEQNARLRVQRTPVVVALDNAARHGIVLNFESTPPRYLDVGSYDDP
jgi:hypothetical protein